MRKIKSREEGFLGLHFDFHADQDCNQIGKTVTEDMIEYVIEKTKPDYIQCDCSGHPGISSYPTKIGNPAPGFIKDQLRIWRDVTAKHNIPLLVHFCGLWSSKNAQNNPQWAIVNSDGSISDKINSYAGGFGKELLVEQLKEVIDQYGIDGVWVDGDSWVADRDFRPQILSEYEKKTGYSKSDILNNETCFIDFTEFCRGKYREYLKDYVDQLHRYKPDFQVCTNWAYSSYMPEPVEVDVDFLSGDVVPLNGFNHSRFDSRYLANQKKPWDIMIWSFAHKPRTHCDTKSANQIKQEAAVTIALGGAVTFYFPQLRRDGSVAKWQMDIMADVSEFCRQRQQLCFQAEQIPQIAMLHSSADYYKKNERLFAPRDPFIIEAKDICQPQIGILQCLLESQNVVDVLSEHQIVSDMDKYRLIVVPEIKYLDEDFIKKLLEYTHQGGSLLVIGTDSANLFRQYLNVSLEGPFDKSVWLGFENSMCTVNSYYRARISDADQKIGGLYPCSDFDDVFTDAASVKTYGKGKIGCIYFDIGENYSFFATPILRRFLKKAVDCLFDDPIVKVEGSQYIDVSLASKDGKILINLINTLSPHSNKNINVFDEIPAIKGINIKITVDSKPSKVILHPENSELEFEFKDNQISLTVDELKIHNVIAIEL